MIRTLQAYGPIILLTVLALMAIPGTILYLFGDFTHSAFQSSAGAGSDISWWPVVAMMLILAGLIHTCKSIYDREQRPTKRR